VGLLAAVHPAKPVRDAADACDLAYQGFNASFLQDAKVYARLKRQLPADAIDARLQRDQLDAFEDSGVALPVAKQQRARRITTELTRLSQNFDRRIREDKTRVAFTEAELQGVPPAVWRAAKRDAQGRYRLGLDYPSVDPVLQKADLGTTRERMWRAAISQGGMANIALLGKLSALRREYAGLFGFRSYADFALRRRMVKDEATATSFLAEVQAAVRQREVADIALLRDVKARQLDSAPEATTVQRWDVNYYTERAREATYAVDQEAFRAYLPPDASLDFVFALAQRLFGVRFAPLAQALWHPSVRAFSVSDGDSGALLGTLFVDLYPRPDKYNHAAVWPVRSASRLADRLPAAGLVVNFNDKGLTLNELETLLHEFGHALHGLLSATRYASQGGTSVQLDFVEAPSQMLEDWVYDPKVLAVMQQVCPSCKPLPPEMVEKAGRARHFAKGIATSRQLLFAGYDLALYGRTPQQPLPLWDRMEGATPLGHVPGTLFPANFSHIATNYAAGYYAYMWSLVLAEDLRTAFAADKLDPAVGRRYRDSVLANGGQVAPEELMQRFLGRPSNREAFFRSLNQQ
jgi:thimet oligopeptidase